jgi:hypothetical protein
VPALGPKEVCRRIKPVLLQPLLAVLDALEFENSSGVCAWVTKQGSVAPREFIELVQGLGLGGHPHRQFCRLLPPRQGIPIHSDSWVLDRGLRLRRFQVPLVTDPRVIMRWPDDAVSMHLEAGWLYEVRFDRNHEVVNDSDTDRIHIQIDQIDATI